MTNKQKLNLAERVQKRIQERHPHFWLIKRRDEIDKELNAESEKGKYGIQENKGFLLLK